MKWGLFLLGVLLVCATTGEAAPARSLSVELTPADREDFGDTFATARSLGLQFSSLSIPWDEIETAKGEFKTGDLESANGFFPSQSVPLVLTISVIDTNILRVPEDLREVPFSDPKLKARFRALLDFVFKELKDTQLIALAIGNEIDALLGDNEQLWAEYLDFYQDAVAYVHAKRKGTQVGAKFGFDGIRSARAKPFIAASDVAMTTYYPLNGDFSVRPVTDVDPDFGAMVAAAQGKPLMILECGFPSAAENGSSERLQRDFILAVFKAWEKYGSAISHLSYFSLTDFGAEVVGDLGDYYGVDSATFVSYLSSLGVRQANGKKKLGFDALKAEAKRGR